MNVAELLATRDHILLDFDGPVCAMFGGAVTNHDVADRLKPLLGHVLTGEIAATHDPFDLLHYAASCDPATARADDAQFRRIESEAVATAPTTAGVAEALPALHQAGFTFTIVSNNSADAIRSFLVLHDLAEYVLGIIGRPAAELSFLRPSPFLIEQAIRSLGTSAEFCVMVGDSLADVEAAHTAGIAVIAYANKEGKGCIRCSWSRYDHRQHSSTEDAAVATAAACQDFVVVSETGHQGLGGAAIRLQPMPRSGAAACMPEPARDRSQVYALRK
jgi:HAD superfamily hydrolase (TIGR01549 family)